MKIPYYAATYILAIQKEKWFQKYCCKWTLSETDNDSFTISGDVRWPVYILLFIPMVIITAIWRMWDGGLKEFAIESRNVVFYRLLKYDFATDRAREVWIKHGEKK